MQFKNIIIISAVNYCFQDLLRTQGLNTQDLSSVSKKGNVQPRAADLDVVFCVGHVTVFLAGVYVCMKALEGLFFFCHMLRIKFLAM